ncbi:MAG: hypothetical protein UU93_C0008G0006 [Candidatus Amesbacteria bacterium GW2011_GWA2_42_12]|uniref:Nucleotidyl transferase AbiEii/AbiGii toxin family protein n=1 Tax=Candidatus Amesbacteria bacterium GW2011_GWA2_42_12 TaxID=1618356 RepID=A0A0G0Y6A4_9BACT|nr:MAG: hypothetical protein UU93_C0008G0006 [Candidatus Amesbacteria bacterium GW2011_GWA2_42_12]
MLDTTKHKTILIRILREIYSHPELAPVLGFKGGTAVFLFYNLPRMSVDLDFDLLDINKKDAVFKKVTAILNKFGTLTEVRDKKYTLFWLVSYEKGLQHAKIEISKRPSESEYEIKNLLGTNIQVMNQSFMFIHKLIALLDRKRLANRDLFDLWYFFSQNWPLNRKVLEKNTNMDFSKYLQTCIEKIEKVEARNILDGLGELLDNKMKYWVKNKLKEELIFFLRASSQP